MVIASCLVSAASVVGYVQFRFGQISTVTINSLRDGGSASPSRPFTMLVVGSDSRALTGANNAQFGTASQTPGQRSDTLLLVRVVPASRTVAILSIPRDLWVPIQGLGSQRINAAFDSGPSLLVSTIQSDLGIPIDHYVEVNFDTFRQITDAIGGVRVYFPTPAKDLYSNLVVSSAGCIALTGDQALAFVRARHYEYYAQGEWHFEGQSDLARIQRQQFFVKKLLKKAESQYSNPLALNGIIAAVTKNLTVDNGFSSAAMVSLARQLRTVNPGAIVSQTLPTFNETVTGSEVLGLQQPQAGQAISTFNNLGTSAATGSPTSGPARSSAPAGGSAPTAASTTNPASIAASSIAVEVANGSGVTGQAGQAVTDLRGLGYVATVDASAGSGFPTNVIRYAPDSEAKAAQLQSQLAGGATLAEDRSLTPTPYNLELITGTSFDGVTSAADRSGGSSPAAASSGAVSSIAGTTTTVPAAPSVTTYVLPGTPPGQLPPTSCQ